MRCVENQSQKPGILTGMESKYDIDAVFSDLLITDFNSVLGVCRNVWSQCICSKTTVFLELIVRGFRILCQLCVHTR